MLQHAKKNARKEDARRVKIYTMKVFCEGDDVARPIKGRSPERRGVGTKRAPGGTGRVLYHTYFVLSWYADRTRRDSSYTSVFMRRSRDALECGFMKVNMLRIT